MTPERTGERIKKGTISGRVRDGVSEDLGTKIL